MAASNPPDSRVIRTELFRGEYYAAASAVRPGNQNVIISFRSFVAHSSFEGSWPLMGMLFGPGFNSIAIVSNSNDWYQHDEIEQVLKIVLDATEGYRRFGFGASMGGFAILNYYHDLKLENVIASAPQATLQRGVVPQDTRMKFLDEHLLLKRDNLMSIPPITKGTVLYDPLGVDQIHATMIAARHTPDFIPMSFSHHAPWELLSMMKLSRHWGPELLLGNFDRQARLREMHAARYREPRAWLNAAEAARNRRKGNYAVALARRALELKPAFDEARIFLFRTFLLMRQPQDALPVLEGHMDRPEFAAKILPIIEPYKNASGKNLVREFYERLVGIADETSAKDPTSEA